MRTDPYRWIPIALAVLVLGVLALAVQNHRLGQRVVALEERLEDERGATAGRDRGARGGRGGRDAGGGLELLDEVDADGAAMVAGRGRPRGSRRGRDGAAGDGAEAATASMEEVLDDPAFQERLGELFEEYSSAEREERRERRTDYIADRIAETVSDFATEHGLDAETEAQVTRILSDHVSQRMELHDAMMEGDGDREALGAEREQLEAETESALVELLGEELYGQLEEQLPGPGRGRPPGPPR